MTSADELGRTLAAIARSFDALGVRWAVGGSIASAAHGEPRSTNDVDVIATLSVQQARAMVEGLHETFYADRAAAEEAVRLKTSINLMRYILEVAGDESFENIQRRIIAVAPATEEVMSTAAEQLIQTGKPREKPRPFWPFSKRAASPSARSSAPESFRAKTSPSSIGGSEKP
jgi:hypothetical protein